MEQEIQKLLVEIEQTERLCLKLKPSDFYEPHPLIFLYEFHKKYDSWKCTHSKEYYEYEQEAYRQQVSILHTQLRVAKNVLNGGTPLF